MKNSLNKVKYGGGGSSLSKNKFAFTLVEIMIVVVIIIILASIAFLRLWNFSTDANSTKRVSYKKNIEQVLEVYKLKNWEYPTFDEEDWEEVFWQIAWEQVRKNLPELPVDPFTKKYYKIWYIPSWKYWKIALVDLDWDKKLLKNYSGTIASQTKPIIPGYTSVDNILNLTPEEIAEVQGKVQVSNPTATVTISNNWTATLAYADNSINTIPSESLVRIKDVWTKKTSRFEVLFWTKKWTNSIIKDNKTWLIWEWFSMYPKTRHEAFTYCYKSERMWLEWRVPKIKEIRWLIDVSLNDYFRLNEKKWYWIYEMWDYFRSWCKDEGYLVYFKNLQTDITNFSTCKNTLSRENLICVSDWTKKNSSKKKFLWEPQKSTCDRSSNWRFETTNNIIKDKKTDLLWSKNISKGDLEKATSYCTWIKDNWVIWRLPTIEELKTIRNFSCIDTSSYDDFNFLSKNTYWSSTRPRYPFGLTSSSNAWHMSMYNGWIDYSGTWGSLDIVCVSDNARSWWYYFSDKNFTFLDWTKKWDNWIVKDNKTWLIWESQWITLKNWEQAKNYCTNLKKWNWKYNWRLPYIYELETLVDYEENDSTSSNYFSFSSIWYYKYWSINQNSNLAWFVRFKNGESNYEFKNSNNNVICVSDQK